MVTKLHRIAKRFREEFTGALGGSVFGAALLALAVTGLPGCSDNNNDSNNSEPTVSLQILWTNDTHGYFFPTYHAEYEELDTYAGTAATEGKVGGYAQIKGLVDSLKAQKTDGNTLFVDGGDTFDGSPTAQITKGAAVIPILNAMGYDAMVPGNRDFAFGKTDFLADTAALTFPVVCANLVDGTTNQYVFPRYIVKQLPGLKVAIIGVTSPLAGGSSTGFKVLNGGVPGAFAIEDNISALAARIRVEENPDLVIVLSHMGYFQDQKFASRSTNIDAIVGAHTHHNIYDAPVVKNKDGSRNVVVVQAGSHGKFLGKLDLTVGMNSRKVIGFNNQLIRMNNQITTTPDAAVQALADAAYAPYQAYFDTFVGYSTTVIARRGATQSTMANLLADAYAATQGTDLARHAGIRYGSSIPGSVANPATITVGDVWNMVSPNIGAGVYVYTQTGAQIKSTIDSGLNTEFGTDPYTWGGGDVTRFNGGLKYTYRVNAPNGQHIVDMTITSGGVDYALVTNGVSDATNLARTYTVTATGTAPAGGTQINPANPNEAVDEIVAYIQAQPSQTVGPVIDNRTQEVQ
jgi:sulfur-oxidizing protein SoxB